MTPHWITSLRAWARRIKIDVGALWIAARDPRTPATAKALAWIVALYAFSPIDLIPDSVPVLGYLDELLLLPAGIALAIRLIPPALMAEFRERATREVDRPSGFVGAALIVAVWLVGAGALSAWALRRFG